MKLCSKCKEEKDESNFSVGKRNKGGLMTWCKDCQAASARSRAAACIANGVCPNHSRRFLIDGKKHCKECIAGMREHRIASLRAGICPNHSEIPAFKWNLCKQCFIVRALRNNTVRIVRHFKNKESASVIRHLGCSLQDFSSYMEGLFQPGMSWKNHGKWHIDHIKPLSSFDLFSVEEQKRACHYTNLQPLWAEDNMKKGASYNV